MTGWLFRRGLQALIVIFAMSVIVFVGVSVIGDPVDILISPSADAMERARIVTGLGLDKSLWHQYINFLKGLAQGDFGRSFVYNEPSLKLILQRFPATLELAIAALLIAVSLGIPLGAYAGLRPKTLASRVIMATSIVGFSLPTFWVGIMLIMIFSVQLGWLPTTGRGTTVSVFGLEWSMFTLDGIRHLLMPALNLALFKLSLVLRLTCSAVQDVMRMDYIKFARAQGLSSRRVIAVHVLKNIMIPIVTVVGLEFGSTIAFAVVTETVFAWPGMGKLIIDSINILDRPVIVAYLLVIVVLFTIINLVADFLYTLLDPRVRLDASK